jgi:hypothetical protein
MFSWLISLFSGGLFSSIFSSIDNFTKAISDEKVAQIKATSDVQKAQIQANIDRLQAQRDVLIADASQSKLDIYIRSLIAIGPTAYLLKIFIYDKVLSNYTMGTTDPLDPNLWNVVTAVLGFYFIATASISISKILKS